MGTSTDGILFYGFDLGEPGEGLTDDELHLDEEECWYRDHWDWETHYAERKGVVREEDDFYERKKAVIEEAGCFIGTHCSGSYPMLYVAVKQHSASRGYPNPIVEEDLVVFSDAESKLKSFCEVMGIVFKPDDVGWYLASYWSS
jgi:hypothetical protein